MSISRAFSLFWAERAFASLLIWVGSLSGTCICSVVSGFCVLYGLLSSVSIVGSSFSVIGSSGQGFGSSVLILNPFSGSLLGS